MNGMLLAAGLGTRFRPYTDLVAKPALPFCNQPLLFYSLKLIESFHLSKLVINTHHLPQTIKDLFVPSFSKLTPQFFHEAPAVLGSGGGIENAKTVLNGSGHFVVCNADEVIIPSKMDTLKKMMDFHIQQNSICTLLTMDHPEVGSKFGGVWCDNKNQILGFGKTSMVNASKALHYVGLMILSDEIFQFLPPNKESNILYDAVSKALSYGKKSYAFPDTCLWFETGNLNDYLLAHKNIITKYHEYKNEYQWFTKLFPNPPQKLDRAQGFIGKQIVHLDNVRASGFVSIGDAAIFDSHVELENCVINARSHINTQKKIQESLSL